MTATLLFLLGTRPAPTGIVTCDVADLRRLDARLSVTAISGEEDRRAYLAFFERLATRYPATAFAREIRRVTLVRDLKFEEVGVGGLSYAGARRVVLSVGHGAETYPLAYLARSFHHEVAHALLDNHGRDLSRRDWEAAHAPSFKYGDSDGWGAIDAGNTSTARDPGLAALGVLSPYAASCYEEDVSSMAEELLTVLPPKEDAARRAFVAAAPRLRRKFDLLAGFYRGLFGPLSLPGFVAPPKSLPKAPSKTPPARPGSRGR